APFLPGSPAPFPLIGRTAELTTLLQTYTQVAPDGYFIGLEGEAGIGKTRLVEEFLAQVQRHGAISVVARCYRGEEQLAYAPFLEGLRNVLGRPDAASRLTHVPAHALAEVGRLFPDLGTYVPPLTAPGGAVTSTQLRLFESLRQILLELVTPRTSSQPGILFLDDLQWADSASVELLSYLVRRLTDFPLLIIVAWRKEGDTQRLDTLLSESQRAGLGTKMTLGRLTPEEVAELATGVLASEHLPTLYQETEGLPFFIIEYLTATRQNRDWLSSVQNLERARLSGLNDTARQVLTTAAVIGRSFDFPTLRETSGRSEDETITGLEALLARGLLVEHAPTNHPRPAGPALTLYPSYDFTHEKIRTVVYEDTSLARRRLLHRRVAEVLINETHPHEANAARIAYHYQHAGHDAEAARWYFRAGDYARKLYANAEGISHYQTALALGFPEPCALHEALGDLLTLQGDYRAAVTSYETAAALAPPSALPPLEHKLANLHHRRGDYDLATSFFQSALETAPPEALLYAHILADWSRTCAQQGDFLRARQLAEQALSRSSAFAGTSEEVENIRVQAQAHNVLGMIARQTEDLPHASHHLEQALNLAEKTHHLPAQVAARNNLALVYADQEDYPHALAMAQIALDLCIRLGDRHLEAALRNRLADLAHASHQPDEAVAHLKKAVEIFAEIGGHPGEYKPEIWKLTEW
ncbi:MAG: AAA family ATPase, partial [Anaerolineales bacterium]|nr:AAA family ATPase [Anaerolineales bacterium]